jgi:hypothetical protein
MSDGRQLPWARSEVVRRLRLSPLLTERLCMLICCIVSDFSEVPARHTELDSAEKTRATDQVECASNCCSWPSIQGHRYGEIKDPRNSGPEERKRIEKFELTWRWRQALEKDGDVCRNKGFTTLPPYGEVLLILVSLNWSLEGQRRKQ